MWRPIRYDGDTKRFKRPQVEGLAQREVANSELDVIEHRSLEVEEDTDRFGSVAEIIARAEPISA